MEPSILPQGDRGTPLPDHSHDAPGGRWGVGTELVGRETECILLRGPVQRAADGHGGLVLVGGEAGIGKTALIECVLAESDLLVLAAEISRHGVKPYGPIATVLRAYHGVVPGGLRRCGPWWRHLAALLPELGRPHLPTDHSALAEAICDAVRAIARRGPAAIFLDDLHWADDATLRLLPRLAATVRDLPVLLIGAYRSEELARDHSLREVRAEIRRRRRLVDLPLKRLERWHTAELAERLLHAAPGPRLAQTLHAVTQGVPFFIEELVAGLAGSARLEPEGDVLELRSDQPIPIPETVRDAVLMRTDDLSGRAREALELVAVAGLRVNRSLLGGRAMQDGVDDLIARGLLVEADEDEVAFRHILVRDAIYGAIPWAARREKHRRLAERLAPSGAAPSLIAEHWAAAKEPAAARPHLLAAAERYSAVHAYHDARAAVARALADWPEGDDDERRIAALEQLGDYAQLCGDLAEAAGAWEQVANARSSADVATMGGAARRLAAIYELAGEWDRAVAARASAASAFRTASRFAEAATERFAAASHLASSGSLGAALATVTAAAEDVERAGGTAELKARTLALEGAIRARLGDGNTGVTMARQALALALAENLVEAAADAYSLLAEALAHASEYSEAIDAYDAATQFCSRQGLTETGYVCFACLAPVLLRAGEWSRAMEVSREVLSSADAPPIARLIARSEVGLIRVLRGQTRDVRRRLTDILAYGLATAALPMRIQPHWGLAMLEELEGDVVAAADRMRTLVAFCASLEERHYSIDPLRWGSTFFARHEDETMVDACVNALSRNTAAGGFEAASALAHALGERDLVRGEAATAAGHFQRSLDLLGGLRAPYERAQAGIRVGVALAAAGQRRLAVDRLVAAYRLASKLGARPIARDAARHVEALGERVDRRVRRRIAGDLDQGGLTRRELEVVRHLATGMTNRQIAAELVLSRRTVDMHVRNILGKLNCRSRAQAAVRVNELGLVVAGDPSVGAADAEITAT